MMLPELVWQRLMWCALLGALLGLPIDLIWSFPSRKRILLQVLIGLLVFAGWLVLCFGICRADIRIGYLAGAAVGFALWQLILGKPARITFGKFWVLLHALIRLCVAPGKKILKKFRKIEKFFFATWKKWVTIGWSKCRINRHPSGGTHDVKQTQPYTALSAEDPAYRTTDQSGDRSRYHIV